MLIAANRLTARPLILMRVLWIAYDEQGLQL